MECQHKPRNKQVSSFLPGFCLRVPLSLSPFFGFPWCWTVTCKRKYHLTELLLVSVFCHRNRKSNENMGSIVPCWGAQCSCFRLFSRVPSSVSKPSDVSRYWQMTLAKQLYPSLCEATVAIPFLNLENLFKDGYAISWSVRSRRKRRSSFRKYLFLLMSEEQDTGPCRLILADGW